MKTTIRALNALGWLYLLASMVALFLRAMTHPVQSLIKGVACFAAASALAWAWKAWMDRRRRRRAA